MTSTFPWHQKQFLAPATITAIPQKIYPILGKYIRNNLHRAEQSYYSTVHVNNSIWILFIHEYLWCCRCHSSMLHQYFIHISALLYALFYSLHTGFETMHAIRVSRTQLFASFDMGHWLKKKPIPGVYVFTYIVQCRSPAR